MYVGDARHAAMMEVNEAGVKAAAVSGMAIMPTNFMPVEKMITVDQPFYCAIYDTQLEMPLFYARIMDPSK